MAFSAFEIYFQNICTIYSLVNLPKNYKSTISLLMRNRDSPFSVEYIKNANEYA
jgi:hypothetical protein